MRLIPVLCLIGFFSISSFSMDSKTLGHIISVPIIEGVGTYSSIRCLQTDNVNNKAAAITNISLLGVNASLGVISMFAGDEIYAKFRKTHRIVGFLVSGAAIWLSVSAVRDDAIGKGDKGVAVGYSALSVVPVFLFSF